jgi:hypothetical protein
MKAVSALTALLLTSSALAQEAHQRAPQAPKVIQFGEEEVIDAPLSGPDVVETTVRRPSAFESMVRVREDFRAEVLESVGELP